jgi:hydroxyacylglutathione hydrolase
MSNSIEVLPTRLTDPVTTSNCYIIKSAEHVLIIDPNDFIKIDHLLQSHCWTPDWVLLTHEHCDHISGLNELRQYYTVKVLTSKACSLGIQSTTLNMTRIMETYLYFKSGGTLLAKYPKFTCSPADVTFEDSFDLNWHEYHFHFISVPGHTPGSVCILVNGKTLFSGDYFLPGEEVATRLPGGNAEIYEKQGKNILRSLPENIWTFPGHGNPFLLTNEVKHEYGLY